MTQPLDFSNQDLRDRSFKGQNLAGANFRKADIRGCDFSNANLEGADFSGVRAGQSRKQIFIAFAIVMAIVIVSTVIGEIAGALGLGGITDVISGGVGGGITGILLSFGVGANEGELGDGGLLAGAGKILVALPFAVMGIFTGINSITSFIKGYPISGVTSILFSLSVSFAAYLILRTAFKEIKNGTGTSFKESILISAKFTSAILGNCDFTDTSIYGADWTYANFKRCKLSSYLNIQLVRELCVSRIGINQDFSFTNLSGLSLIGVSFRGANLTAANLNETNLSHADLENTNLCNVQAIRTNFTGSNLSGACIENWAITSETNFTNVVCSHIFLDNTRTERQPASGFLEQGDFAKLVTQSTKSLDFFFRNGIDPQAFDFAFKKLRDEYPEMEISLKAVQDLGDGDRIVRFNTIADAPKGEMHAQFTQDYEEMHQQLEASRNKVWELQQKLDRIDLENKIERLELEKQLAVAIAKLEERPTSKDLQNLLYHQSSQLGKQRLLNAPNSTFIDTMTDKPNQINISSSSNVTLNTGDNNQGVIGNISGTVTNTIQQLRETNQPEAPQLSDLLEQLQKAVESSSELGEPEKQKALEYLNQIGEMSAKDPSQKKGMLPILLDAFIGVISKAANLIDPVKKIVAAILSIWQA